MVSVTSAIKIAAAASAIALGAIALFTELQNSFPDAFEKVSARVLGRKKEISDLTP